MQAKPLTTAAIAIAPFIAAWAALFIGAYNLTPLAVVKALAEGLSLAGGALDSPEQAIVWDIRLPRVLLAGLVGIALAVSGVTFQGIFRNPLVDPYILGISAGAALGCALTVGFLPHLPVQVMAFGFGILAVFLAYSMAKTQGEVSRLPLILSGVIMSAFFMAMVSIVKFLVEPMKLQNIVFWLMGSFSLADWKLVGIAGGGICCGLIPLFSCDGG